MTSTDTSLTLVFPHDDESWDALLKRLRDTSGQLLLVLGTKEEPLAEDKPQRILFLEECKKLRQRMRFAAKHPVIVHALRDHGFTVYDRTSQLKTILEKHPKLDEALREFSPHVWKQQLKTQLQRMGLLSVPKLRIFSLVGLSCLLFFFVLFKLLPSADIYVKPRQENISQTVNILLAQSGADAVTKQHVRSMPLIPLKVIVTKQITFDQISKEFIGTSATMPMTVVNKSKDPYSFKATTRFSNQAGMIFRIKEAVTIEPGQETTVMAKADDSDLFGQIIGARGNVPAGLRWDIPGLPEDERKLVYGENRKAATGGTTAYRTVLQKQDLEVAQKRLEKELLADAKQQVQDELNVRNARNSEQTLELLNNDTLTKTWYAPVAAPKDMIGKPVLNVTLSGSVHYVAYAYDVTSMLAALSKELRSHVREGKKLIEDGIDRSRLVVHVISWDDAFSWIKLTVDLTGTEEYILDALTPEGAMFGKNVREKVAGLSSVEAVRIIKNMPEVENVRIASWPPWNRKLPGIPSHISIVPESR